jgi:hypothetical protein
LARVTIHKGKHSQQVPKGLYDIVTSLLDASQLSKVKFKLKLGRPVKGSSALKGLSSLQVVDHALAMTIQPGSNDTALEVKLYPEGHNWDVNDAAKRIIEAAIKIGFISASFSSRVQIQTNGHQPQIAKTSATPLSTDVNRATEVRGDRPFLRFWTDERIKALIKIISNPYVIESDLLAAIEVVAEDSTGQKPSVQQRGALKRGLAEKKIVYNDNGQYEFTEQYRGYTGVEAIESDQSALPAINDIAKQIQQRINVIRPQLAGSDEVRDQIAQYNQAIQELTSQLATFEPLAKELERLEPMLELAQA